MNEAEFIALNQTKSPELIFQYMIFQTDINKNIVWYYLDGSRSRRTLRVEQLLKTVQERWPNLVHDVYEACRTTSFYLLDSTIPSLIHLFPQASNEPYVDNVQQVMNDRKAGQKTKMLVKEKTNINDVLHGYGFAPLDQSKMDAFNVTMKPSEPDTREGFLSRFLHRH